MPKIPKVGKVCIRKARHFTKIRGNTLGGRGLCFAECPLIKLGVENTKGAISVHLSQCLLGWDLAGHWQFLYVIFSASIFSCALLKSMLGYPSSGLSQLPFPPISSSLLVRD